MSDIAHFWTPPDGEHILGLTRFRDMILVATTRGVWVISDHPLDDFVVRQLTEQLASNDKR